MTTARWTTQECFATGALAPLLLVILATVQPISAASNPRLSTADLHFSHAHRAVAEHADFARAVIVGIGNGAITYLGDSIPSQGYSLFLGRRDQRSVATYRVFPITVPADIDYLLPRIESVAIDRNGYVALVGSSRGHVTIRASSGTQSLQVTEAPAGATDAGFIAIADPELQLLGVLPTRRVLRTVAAAPDGFVAAGGDRYAEDGGDADRIGEVMSFATTGDHRWTATIANADVRSVSVNAAGTIAVAGWFRDAMQAGDRRLEAVGDSTFVGTLSRGGHILWAAVLGSGCPRLDALYTKGIDVFVTRERAVWASGHYCGSGPSRTSLPAPYIARLDSDGHLRWVRSVVRVVDGLRPVTNVSFLREAAPQAVVIENFHPHHTADLASASTKGFLPVPRAAPMKVTSDGQIRDLNGTDQLRTRSAPLALATAEVFGHHPVGLELLDWVLNFPEDAGSVFFRDLRKPDLRIVPPQWLLAAHHTGTTFSHAAVSLLAVAGEGRTPGGPLRRCCEVLASYGLWSENGSSGHAASLGRQPLTDAARDLLNYTAGLRVRASRIPGATAAELVRSARSAKVLFAIDDAQKDHVLSLMHEMVDSVEWHYSADDRAWGALLELVNERLRLLWSAVGFHNSDVSTGHPGFLVGGSIPAPGTPHEQIGRLMYGEGVWRMGGWEDTLTLYDYRLARNRTGVVEVGGDGRPSDGIVSVEFPEPRRVLYGGEGLVEWKRYEGGLEQGLFQGDGVLTYDVVATGTCVRHEGKFVKGIPHGLGLRGPCSGSENGAATSTDTQGDLLNPRARERHGERIEAGGVFVNGVLKDGAIVRYSPLGDVEQFDAHRDGNRHYSVDYHAPGVPRVVMDYTTGVTQRFHYDGSPWRGGNLAYIHESDGGDDYTLVFPSGDRWEGTSIGGEIVTGQGTYYGVDGQRHDAELYVAADGGGLTVRWTEWVREERGGDGLGQILGTVGTALGVAIGTAICASTAPLCAAGVAATGGLIGSVVGSEIEGEDSGYTGTGPITLGPNPGTEATSSGRQPASRYYRTARLARRLLKDADWWWRMSRVPERMLFFSRDYDVLASEVQYGETVDAWVVTRRDGSYVGMTLQYGGILMDPKEHAQHRIDLTGTKGGRVSPEGLLLPPREVR